MPSFYTGRSCFNNVFLFTIRSQTLTTRTAGRTTRRPSSNRSHRKTVHKHHPDTYVAAPALVASFSWTGATSSPPTSFPTTRRSEPWPRTSASAARSGAKRCARRPRRRSAAATLVWQRSTTLLRWTPPRLARARRVEHKLVEHGRLPRPAPAQTRSHRVFPARSASC